MTKKNVVNVTIQGAEYTLRTETSPEHARAVAEYVDQIIGETMESGARIESHKAAMLANSTPTKFPALPVNCSRSGTRGRPSQPT